MLKNVVIAFQFSSVQSLSRVWLFATPWIAARKASLSITNSRTTSLAVPQNKRNPREGDWKYGGIEAKFLHMYLWVEGNQIPLMSQDLG